MPWVKGQIAWNKGKKLGFTPKGAFRAGQIPWNKGRKGRQSYHNIKGLAVGWGWNKGLPALWATAEKSHLWKGGITKENHKVRQSIEYRLWREAVFARDHWNCQNCGKLNGDKHSHHIKSFSHYPELRFAIDNGITLCVGCHTKLHTGKNTMATAQPKESNGE